MNLLLVFAVLATVVAAAAIAWAVKERLRAATAEARVAMLEEQGEMVQAQAAQSAASVAEAILKRNEEAVTAREQLAQAKIEAQLKPVAETLAKFQEQVATAEKLRAEESGGLICVVEEVGALWALERAGAYSGRYHVLGGLLSALEGRGPEALRVETLIQWAAGGEVREVILALPATVDGQTTAHYIADRLTGTGAAVTMLARGVPVGGELDWLDDGTIAQALRARRPA